MCGDIVYDLQNAVIDPYHVSLDREPQTTGNHALTKRQEKAAIKRALNSGTFFLHRATTTRPASSTAASSLASSRGAFPAPRLPVEHRFTSETHEPGHGHEEWLPPVRV